MHSRIFGLSQPSKKLEVFKHSEEQVYEAMQGYADYVIEEDANELFDSWQWLAKAYGNVLDVRREANEDERHYYIVVNRKKLQDYFEEDFYQFKELVEDLTLKEYVDYWSRDMYSIEQKIRSTTGFWVLDSNNNYTDLTTFGDWLKIIYGKMRRENVEEVEFEIIETFDYHN